MTVTKSIIKIIANCFYLWQKKGVRNIIPILFLITPLMISASNSSSNVAGNIFRQLEAVASQRVADIDYEQQIS